MCIINSWTLELGCQHQITKLMSMCLLWALLTPQIHLVVESTNWETHHPSIDAWGRMPMGSLVNCKFHIHEVVSFSKGPSRGSQCTSHCTCAFIDIFSLFIEVPHDVFIVLSKKLYLVQTSKCDVWNIAYEAPIMSSMLGTNGNALNHNLTNSSVLRAYWQVNTRN